MKECIVKWLTEQFGDDDNLIAEVYAEYKNTLAQHLGELAEARVAGDAVKIDRILHTIKGSAAMVGDTEVSVFAAESRKLTDPAALEAAELKLREFASKL